jgi:hypothetical protein
MTSREATRQGFLTQAKVKTERAQAFLIEADELRAALQDIESPEDLADVKVESLRSMLLSAAGFSEKARVHISRDGLDSALQEVVDRIATSSPCSL